MSTAGGRPTMLAWRSISKRRIRRLFRRCSDLLAIACSGRCPAITDTCMWKMDRAVPRQTNAPRARPFVPRRRRDNEPACMPVAKECVNRPVRTTKRPPTSTSAITRLAKCLVAVVRGARTGPTTGDYVARPPRVGPNAFRSLKTPQCLPCCLRSRAMRRRWRTVATPRNVPERWLARLCGFLQHFQQS
jgi:hypothetical protein